MDKNIEGIKDCIDSIYGCDCAYYGVDGIAIATVLHNEGYRRQSEAAREIFEEIDKRFEALLKFYPCNGEFEDAKRFVEFHWKHIRHSIMCDYDAELKYKYTEEKKT